MIRKKYRFVLISIFICLFLLLIYTINGYANKNRSEMLSTEFRDVFEQEYALSENKSIGDGQLYSLTGSQFEGEILTFLNSLNKKPVINKDELADLFTSMQDVPHALTECEADITRINESLNEVPDIDISSTSSLNFDFFFNSQLSGINGFKGFVNRIYYPQYEGVNLINLGYKISGRINQDETFTNLYKGGIELLSPISCKKSIEVQLLSHNDYIDLLNSGNLRIYQYENFRSDFSFWYFSTNEWEEDIDKISGIIVDEISIDYFYEKENDVVIPILNHQAHYNGVKGRVDFNFWVWGINVK